MVDLFENLQLRTGAEVPLAKLRELLARDAVGRLAVGVHKIAVCRAFMVDRKDSTTCVGGRVATVGIDKVQIHAVMVVANAARPVIGLCAAV